MIESYLTDKILKLYKNIRARIHTVKNVRILAFVYLRVDLKLKVHVRA
ncbi:hypothetical protein SDC9_169626 [bioreactor metagenome]|uniref:Uncharacterized protein n=1 Tax=bioreactor metagenome TaxID=1076179 RepID=A0A645GEM1_9ZZZZ